MALPATHEDDLPSGVEVHTSHATDEEHEAAGMELLGHERAFHSNNLPIAETTHTSSAREENLHEVEMSARFKKRDTMTCFNGGGFGLCYGVAHDQAIDAAAWFCSSHNGMEIDNTPTNGPISFAAN